MKIHCDLWGLVYSEKIFQSSLWPEKGPDGSSKINQVWSEKADMVVLKWIMQYNISHSMIIGQLVLERHLASWAGCFITLTTVQIYIPTCLYLPSFTSSAWVHYCTTEIWNEHENLPVGLGLMRFVDRVDILIVYLFMLLVVDMAFISHVKQVWWRYLGCQQILRSTVQYKYTCKELQGQYKSLGFTQEILVYNGVDIGWYKYRYMMDETWKLKSS